MRRLLALPLLTALAFGGPALREISRHDFVGIPVGFAPIAAGEGYLPTILTKRKGHGHFRVCRLDLDAITENKVEGIAVMAARYGGGSLIAFWRKTKLTLVEYSHSGRNRVSTDHGQIDMAAFRDPRLLSLGATPDGPLAVIGHENGLYVAVVKRRNRGAADLIARPGVRFLAATRPRHANRDGKLDIFAVGTGNRIAHLEQERGRFRLASEVTYQAKGFEPRAMVAMPRFLFLCGRNGDRSVMLVFEMRSIVGRRSGRPGAPRAAPVQMTFGSGSIDHVAVLDPDHIVVAGVQDGRSWVAVVALGGRQPVIVHEAYLRGTGVTAIGVNPKREGWSIVAGTREKTVSLLRIPGDPALPKSYDPFPPRDDRTGPAPQPEPGPAPHPEQPAGDQPGPFAEDVQPGGLALLPTVEVDRRRAIDTSIVLVYTGRGRAALDLHLVSDSGRVLVSKRVLLRRGQRARISLAAALQTVGVGRFEGYARVDGGTKRNLVVEGMFLNGAQRTVLRAHWR